MRGLACLLFFVLLAIAAPGCDLWALAADEEPNPCAVGAGGAEGAGGDGLGGDVGAGGALGEGTSAGAGGATTGVGVGAEPASSDVSAGVGVGAGPGLRSVPHAPRRGRHQRGGIGVARQALCPGLPSGLPPMWEPKAPVVGLLTTTKLRQIAAGQGIGAGLTGIQLNRAYGLAFENWVLTMMGQLPRWTALIPSPARQQKNLANGGLPGSVIPEQVTTLALVNWGAMMAKPYPVSAFWEVKAVNGPLTLSTSRWQILGLIDVAAISFAGLSTDPKAPPPQVVFTITGNTTIGQDVLTTATQRGVAIWVQAVFYDATDPNDPNPDLYIGPRGPMNEAVYGSALPIVVPASGVGSKLTSPTTAPMPVPGDPDPPEVD